MHRFQVQNEHFTRQLRTSGLKQKEFGLRRHIIVAHIEENLTNVLPNLRSWHV